MCGVLVAFSKMGISMKMIAVMLQKKYFLGGQILIFPDLN